MKKAHMLTGKHALIFGAGGSFGSVVAREFAAEGAEVFLSGRSTSSVEQVAKHIAADGEAHTSQSSMRRTPRRWTRISMESLARQEASMSCSTWSAHG